MTRSGVVFLLALLLPLPAGPACSSKASGADGGNDGGPGGEQQVFVPAGTFTMGQDGGRTFEAPSHVVSLSAFWIDRLEVTNANYRECVQAGACTVPSNDSSSAITPYYSSPTYADYPVNWVSWDQADAFCRWRGARLPTEAEWEKAARGTDGREYPWGNGGLACDHANYNACGNVDRVGARPLGASPYGALDMIGNVWEWCSDWYLDTYYAASPPSDPTGPADGSTKVYRGGGHDSSAYTYTRASTTRTLSTLELGFRCAQTR